MCFRRRDASPCSCVTTVRWKGIAIFLSVCCWFLLFLHSFDQAPQVAFALRCVGAHGGVQTRIPVLRRHALQRPALAVKDVQEVGDSLADYVPIFDFARVSSMQAALLKFERVDDVVMGGVSKSQLVASDGCASWRGLVRTAGGGFCGQRTKQMVKPLNLTGADGLYLKCRLSSDEDASRRSWKLALRTDEGRGEVVYQAPFLPPTSLSAKIKVPFDEFVLVRGPIAVPNAPPLSNVSAVYQLGFTVSKFVISSQMKTVDDFRNGSFQLDIEELGVYTESPLSGVMPDFVDMPASLSDEEVKRKRPLLLKAVLPILGLLFSEGKRRKRRAADLLKSRGATRWQRLGLYPWKFKRNLRGYGIAFASLQSCQEFVSASLAWMLSLPARWILFPIFRIQNRRERRKLEAKMKATTTTQQQRQ
eukprot:TRINITY_DN29483_c0_g1_i1.p1 TRINITY_DN29483_c0_g1~~TRINITY_DN29483_c0_g1_i1.p1  ORF type:complete len:427 (-),score=51.65 TRINITY_DN29483_c0_g1_i1:161-1417(-)